ncbi:efflux RND transporter periplasmic adaptor subunit [Methylobacterium isbiliense]|uniref:efflux RND transporter periplasmic adaptor subunit n=1 Tax=Methylobacterium isbiliense TaxID=315478 RepID=UPI001EE273D1|nr:efflux RND transporter periplasmic adaptor subunit [Methylobacterium isbiliense]MDN3625692.1 efflux RND transporter periplasmic adaptor subunit [Methylobacterium isbiliense]
MNDVADQDLRPLAMRPWVQLLVVSVLVAGGAGAFWYRHPAKVEAAPVVTPGSAFVPPRDGGLILTEAQLATLTVNTVEARRFSEEIATEGKISVDEYRATPVFSPYPGRIVQIFGRTGERVEQGQRLFSIQANEMVQAQNDYLAALNVLNKSRSQFNFATSAEKRQRDLYETRATTLRELQSAQNDLTSATNDLRTAEVGLEAVRNRLRILGLTDADMTALQQKGAINPETMINAPLSGTIIQRKIGPGQYVTTGGSDPSYVIGDLSKVWLVAQLREPDAAKVDLGELVRFRVLAFPDRIFEARVNFIGSSVDPASRRITVRADVENRQNLLKPEMYASVRIVNEREAASLSVPRAAVIFEGDRASVWVLGEGNAVESRRIKAGIVSGGNVEVLDGLNIGEKVISKGALFVDRMAATE